MGCDRGGRMARRQHQPGRGATNRGLILSADVCTLSEAAARLGKSPATLRRWIAEGAPCVAPGAAGRGRGAVIDIEAIRRWRAAGGATVPNEEWLRQVAASTMAFYRERKHDLIGLSDREAA